MPKRKLKVLRREEPTQVAEPCSSWLQLQKEKGEMVDEAAAIRRERRDIRGKIQRKGEEERERTQTKIVQPPPPQTS